MKKLLIVEDDPHTQEMLKYISKKIGYDPMVAATFKEALKTIRDNDDIEVITVDMRLPDGNGSILINRIKGLLNMDVKIIVFTANMSSYDFWKDRDIEVDAKIRKGQSNTLKDLRKALTRLWDSVTIQNNIKINVA